MQEDEPQKIEVVSYKEVFIYYYEKTKDKYCDVLNCISLEEFINKYYAQPLTIKKFSDCITSEEFTFNEESEQLILNYSFDNNIMPLNGMLEILSPDEGYILGADLNTNVPTSSNEFNYVPTYEAFNYSRLAVGDIIFEGGSKSTAKHAAFIYNTSQPSCYGDYVQTIEAVAGGVQYGLLDDDRMVRFGVSIIRIYRAGELGVVSAAKEFIKKQLGKPYCMDFTKTKTDIQSSSWYCSELIFAAYYNGGMDICSSRDFDFNPKSMPCIPVYLTRGLLSMGINLNAEYLLLSIEKFNSSWLWNSSYWTIKVTNLNDKPLTVYYNSKMCYTQDAKDWKNLKDIKSVVISRKSYVNIDVYQNLSATTIATSYLLEGYRYVTYGTDLSKVDYSINNGYNRI